MGLAGLREGWIMAGMKSSSGKEVEWRGREGLERHAQPGTSFIGSGESVKVLGRERVRSEFCLWGFI